MVAVPAARVLVGVDFTSAPTARKPIRLAFGQRRGAVVKLDGLVVTKLDGTAKGGAIISLCREFGLPVLWVGVGEDLEDLIPFSREEYVQGLYLKDGDGADLIPDPAALPEGKTAADYYLGV